MIDSTPTREPEFGFRPGERASLPESLREHAAALRRLVVAIDGPAGSGKSSTARAVAARLGLVCLDTGAMYRALTLLALRAGVDSQDGAALAQLARTHAIGFEASAAAPRVQLDGEDVSAAVRSPEVTAMVSQVSAHPEVRREMVRRQRQIGAPGGVVLDGRDIGTVVFPDADVKVYVTADVHTRARRRQLEDAARGTAASLEEIEADIRRRDAEDSTRAASPLVRAPDAVLLDTSSHDLESQVDAVLALAVRALGVRGRAAARGPLATLVPADLESACQAGYRRWHSLLHRVVRKLIVWLGWLFLGLRIHMHPSVRLRGSALVACNHIAGLDPPICGASVPFECWYVAKLELFRTPALARLISRFNGIPIHRGTADYATLDRAVELLQSARNVFMFPEGTRQRPGRLGRAKWGFGYVATRAGRPIVPMFVRGTKDRRVRGLRREPLEIWIGEPVEIRPAPGAAPHALYKQVGELVMERIAGLMLRSAAGVPLAGLDLPGAYAGAQTVPTEPADATGGR